MNAPRSLLRALWQRVPFRQVLVRFLKSEEEKIFREVHETRELFAILKRALKRQPLSNGERRFAWLQTVDILKLIPALALYLVLAPLPFSFIPTLFLLKWLRLLPDAWYTPPPVIEN